MNKIHLSWKNIDTLAIDLVKMSLAKKLLRRNSLLPISLYGVPRGGLFAAIVVQKYLLEIEVESILVNTPEESDFIIDDIVDTGRTKAAYAKYKKPFYALIDDKEDATWYVFPWETIQNEQGPEENVIRILEYLGEDTKRNGLLDTPKRVVKSWSTLYSGYAVKEEEIKNVLTFFEDTCDEMVILKEIEFYSTCEHHMLPFFGKAHIAYLPNGRVVGISKLARLLEIYSRRLQIQERICTQVTSSLDEYLGTKGSACVLEAQHFCMTSRGVQKQHSKMVTSSLTGNFREGPVRAEFFNLIGK